MHDFKLYKHCVEQLTQQLTGAKHRQLVLITGQPTWCYELLSALTRSDDVKLLSSSLANASWPEHTHQLLGQEFPHAVYDGFSGIYPDKLAALAGTVKAGGLLFLLLPDLQRLASWQDPALQSVQSYGCSNQQSYFNLRFSRLLQTLPAIHFDEHTDFKQPPLKSNVTNKIEYQAQQHCVEQIIKVATGRANRPLIINADRGRGKSAALGLAAAALHDKKIIVCATQFRATHSCFKHLAKTLQVEYKAQQKHLANLHYMAPDALLNQLPPCDLLLVDEAAAIPIPLLLTMLKHYPRIVFASTLVGYEGNGRGYTIRFTQYIKVNYKAAKIVNLEEPLRFAKGDPLEQHVRTLFALDAQYNEYPPALNNIEHIEVTQQQLVDNEPLLQQIVALLALAHYQSSVNDLRQLLDAPAQRLFISRCDMHVVGVCLIAVEGGMDAELAKQVISGERRPQGHLMAQSLAQLSAQPSYLTKQSARVIRIAVAPNLHQQGVGKALLAHCQHQLTPTCSYIGASFGATAGLLRFWQSQDFSAVKLGYQRDKSTGEHSALVIKALNTSTQGLHTLAQQFKSDLFYGLLTHFSQLDSELVSELISKFIDESSVPSQPINTAISTINRFNTAPKLWYLFNHSPSSLMATKSEDRHLLIQMVLQNHSNEQLIKQHRLSGKKALEQQFKLAVKSLIKKPHNL